jgi:hypothetical protein
MSREQLLGEFPLPLNTSGSLHNVVDTNALTQSFVALKLLLTKMQDVFETVEPAQGNMQTYGWRSVDRPITSRKFVIPGRNKADSNVELV